MILLDRRLVVSLAAAITICHSIASAHTNSVQASKQLTASDISASTILAFDGAKAVVFADLVAHELLQRGVALVERAKLNSVLRERQLGVEDLASGRADLAVIGEATRVDTIVFRSVTPITVYTERRPVRKNFCRGVSLG